MSFPDSVRQVWRAMTPADLPRVGTIAAQIHAAYPEDAAVFAERLRLYPAGCRVLETEGLVRGYVLSHPWRLGKPPALNRLLGALPERPDTYYLHDLALLPAARGFGAGTAIVAALVEQARAERLRTLSLVAVHEAAAFWRRHGFAAVPDAMMAEKLGSYGAEACFMVRRLG